MAAMKKVLVINPNSSPSITNVLDEHIQDILKQIPFSAAIETYTAPSGPPSIDDYEDALMSAKAVMADLQFNLAKYDAYLVACYNLHPLVGMLKAAVPPRVHVTGIFEASISMALSLLPLNGTAKFGIISTTTYWETDLAESVKKYCGSESLTNQRFKGVQITGLTATEFQTPDSEEANSSIKLATKNMVRDRDVRVICLDCVAPARLNKIVGEALVEELGDEAESVYIVDGVHAGIGLLQSLLGAFPAKKSVVLDHTDTV